MNHILYQDNTFKTPIVEKTVNYYYDILKRQLFEEKTVNFHFNDYFCRCGDFKKHLLGNARVRGGVE